MFDLDRFRDDCVEACREGDSRQAIQALVERAVSRPGEVVRQLGEHQRAGVQTLYHGPDLTVLDVRWAPEMEFHPHDHRMWAVIGIYAGREDNVFYRRTQHGLRQEGARSLHPGDVNAMGEHAIHGVRTPPAQLTWAIHVYGGDFFAEPRSEWDPETFEEHPYSMENMRRLFEEANERMRTMASSPAG